MASCIFIIDANAHNQSVGHQDNLRETKPTLPPCSPPPKKKNKKVSILDDASILSTNERNFIRLHPTRTDGRQWDQVRSRTLTLTRGDNTAHATVAWGSSRVTCHCYCTLTEPYPDRPNEGLVAISVEASPAASTSFRLTQPTSTLAAGGGGGPRAPADEAQKVLTNRILGCLERLLLAQNGGALDAEALCVVPDEWVWKLHVEVTILDASGGNLLDVSVLACMAAIRHYRQPQTVSSTAGQPRLVNMDVKEAAPLPVHHTPLTLSFCYLAAEEMGASVVSEPKILVDPSSREELVASRGGNSSWITLAMNIHGEICFLDFGGGCELRPSNLRHVYESAHKLLQLDLCTALETSLKEADAKAMEERLQRIQQRKQQSGDEPVDENTLVPNVPFYEASAPLPIGDPDDSDAQRARDAAEEAYRQNALDYNQGHVATRIKENEDKVPAAANSLLELLQSAGSSTGTTTDGKVVPQSLTATEPMLAENASTNKKVSLPQKSDTPVKSSKSTPVETHEEEEEEQTMQLQSEFSEPMEEEGDIDLSSAIKSKKKKKKKGKN